MGNGILGIDHAVIAAGDTGAQKLAAEAYEKLGFVFASEADSGGFTARHIEFDDNFFAVVGVYDESKLVRKQRDDYIVKRKGVTKILLGTEDAYATARALVDEGQVVETRMFKIPRKGRNGDVVSKNVVLEFWDIARPTFRLIVLEHVTRDLRDKGHKHPNTARAIEGFIAAVNDPAAAVARYAGFSNRAVVDRSESTIRYPLGKHSVTFVTPDEAARLYPGIALDEDYTDPVVVATRIAVADLDAAARCVEAGSMRALARGKGNIAVQPHGAPPLVIDFVQ